MTSLNSCMWYKELPNKQIKLGPKEELELDIISDKILIPMTESRIFMHWYNDKGKLVNSHQLKYSTLINQKVKLINSDSKDVVILQIDVSST